MKNKGFTLVELLVTISILGLVTVMSMPIIRNIIEANTLKKYTTYKDSVESSAKLYVDSYSEDLFGKNRSGCAYITYDQMKDKNLIKNIQENGVSCNSDKTYVRVVKLNGKYSYATQIGCGNSNDKGKITSSKVNVVYPKDGVPRNETCSYDAVTKLDVSADPEKYLKTDKKKYAVAIVLKSFTGKNNGVQVSYAWHKDGTDSSKDVWQEATFRGLSSTNQEKDILNGKVITLKSSEILTPDKETGNYKLLVKINSAMDITGTNLITEQNETRTFETYKIDNLPPIINSLSISSSDESFNSLKAKVNINATDNNMMSSQNEIKVCIKTNKNTCLSNDYKEYKSSYDITLPGGKYDGSKKTIYVYVKDNAGNITSKTADYTLYKECTNSVLDSDNLIKKGDCTKKCGSNGTRLDTYGTKDKYTGVKCDSTLKKKEVCNRVDCCSKVIYKDGDSCSNPKTFCGSGTKNQLAYSDYDNTIRCTAYDKSSGGSSCDLGPCKPNKPTIINPTKENWTNKDFSLTVKTTTQANNLGYWYYSYDASKWITYNNQSYNSYGKSEFITSPFSVQRNQLAYIKVCNKKASGPTDTANCSDYASTYIRIDKTNPTGSITFHGHTGYVRSDQLAFIYGDKLGEGPYANVSSSDDRSGISTKYVYCTTTDSSIATANCSSTLCKIDIKSGKNGTEFRQEPAVISCRLTITDKAGNINTIISNQNVGNGWIVVTPNTCTNGKTNNYWNYVDNYKVVKNSWIHTYWHRTNNYLWYYAEADGKIASDWKMINGKWYFFYRVSDNCEYFDFTTAAASSSQPYDYPFGAMVWNDTVIKKSTNEKWTMNSDGVCISGRGC